MAPGHPRPGSPTGIDSSLVERCSSCCFFSSSKILRRHYIRPHTNTLRSELLCHRRIGELCAAHRTPPDLRVCRRRRPPRYMVPPQYTPIHAPVVAEASIVCDSIRWTVIEQDEATAPLLRSLTMLATTKQPVRYNAIFSTNSRRVVPIQLVPTNCCVYPCP